jgi:hypothetical protein
MTHNPGWREIRQQKYDMERRAKAARRMAEGPQPWWLDPDLTDETKGKIVHEKQRRYEVKMNRERTRECRWARRHQKTRRRLVFWRAISPVRHIPPEDATDRSKRAWGVLRRRAALAHEHRHNRFMADAEGTDFYAGRYRVKEEA